MLAQPEHLNHSAVFTPFTFNSLQHEVTQAADDCRVWPSFRLPLLLGTSSYSMAQSTAVAALLGAAGTAFIAPGSTRPSTAPALRGASPVDAGAQGSSAGLAGTAALASLAGVAMAAAAGRKAGATSCRAAAVKKKGVKVVHGKESQGLSHAESQFMPHTYQSM